MPEIAKQLGVAHVLEGSVQKSGDTVRVNVQLIKAADDSHLWADTFDRKLIDVFSVESEVAKAIAASVAGEAHGSGGASHAAKPTDNPEAYDAYLRGLAYTLKTGSDPPTPLARRNISKKRCDWTRTSLLAGRCCLTWMRVAILHRVFNQRSPFAKRARGSRNALRLQPNLGEALLAKGFYHYACLKDYDTAVNYLEQAHRVLPNNSRILEVLAYVERRRGHWDKSEAYFNEAEKLDPRNVNLLSQHARSTSAFVVFLKRWRSLSRFSI